MPTNDNDAEAVLRKEDGWSVKTIYLSTALECVKQWHYAKTASNTATARHGLFDPNGEVVGACIWIPPTKGAALTVSQEWQGVLACSRLVCSPACPKNAASFLLGRSIKLLPYRWHTLLTYADSNQGHTGQIYKATNWEYLGPVPAGDVWTHIETGQQRGRKRGPKTMLASEMVAEGYVKNPPGVKHKFVIRR